MTFTPRPPRRWELLTYVLIAAVAASTLLGILLGATDLGVRHYLTTGGASGMSPMVRWIAIHNAALDALGMLLVLIYIGCFVGWRRTTHTMLREYGDDSGTATKHWTVRAWGLSIGTGLVVQFAGRPHSATTRDGLISVLGTNAVLQGVRLIGMTFLLIAIWQIREQVRQVIARSGLDLRNPRSGPRPSAFPAAPLPPVEHADHTPAGGHRPADDAFWAEVTRQATGLRADLALLESTGPLVHRWVLVPATGDVSAIRAAVPPGAVVTVFTEPPAATETKGYTPAPADEYHGFLEDAGSGALWFQAVTPKRVGAFLARARSARRWGLYPTGDPTALTALVPAVTPEPADRT